MCWKKNAKSWAMNKFEISGKIKKNVLVITCDEMWIFQYDPETKNNPCTGKYQPLWEWKKQDKASPSSRSCWLFSLMWRVSSWNIGYQKGRQWTKSLQACFEMLREWTHKKRPECWKNVFFNFTRNFKFIHCSTLLGIFFLAHGKNTSVTNDSCNTITKATEPKLLGHVKTW